MSGTGAPLIFVVGEPPLHDALGGAPDVDVHSQTWASYTEFLESVEAGEIPIYGAEPVVVVVSDQLQDDQVSLERFLSFVNGIAILVPWHLSVEAASKIADVVVASPVTKNSLRQAVGRRLDRLILPIEDGNEVVSVEVIDLTTHEAFDPEESEARAIKNLAAFRQTRATTPEFLGNVSRDPATVNLPTVKPDLGSDVVAVYSPKAGLDRTEVAIRLARRIQAVGKTVCIIDLDQVFGDLGAHLGMTTPTVGELLHLQILSADVVCSRIPTDPSGIAVVLPLTAPERAEMAELASPDAYRELIGALAVGFDVTILDCPFGLADPWTRLGFWQANAIMIVGDDSAETIADVGQVASLLTRSIDDKYLPGYEISSDRVGIITVDPTQRQLGVGVEMLDGALTEVLGMSLQEEMDIEPTP